MERDRESQKDTEKQAERNRTQKMLRRNILDGPKFRLSTASLSKESKDTDLHPSGVKLHRGICCA